MVINAGTGIPVLALRSIAVLTTAIHSNNTCSILYEYIQQFAVQLEHTLFDIQYL